MQITGFSTFQGILGEVRARVTVDNIALFPFMGATWITAAGEVYDFQSVQDIWFLDNVVELDISHATNGQFVSREQYQAQKGTLIFKLWNKHPSPDAAGLEQLGEFHAPTPLNVDAIIQEGAAAVGGAVADVGVPLIGNIAMLGLVALFILREGKK